MLYFEIYLFCCIKMFVFNSFNFSMNEKHNLCIIHFPFDGRVGCFQFFVFKPILQWAYSYSFLCMCGRVTPGGIYQSGTAFPNCSANYTFMLLRKILTLPGVFLGFTWARMEWLSIQALLVFLFFTKACQHQLYSLLRLKGITWQKPYVGLLSEKTNSKPHLVKIFQTLRWENNSYGRLPGKYSVYPFFLIL